MAGIFISYRRIDSKAYAGRLFDRLARHFGRGNVFMDVEGGIAHGEDFHQALERAINSVDAMVVVIGVRWLTCADEQGRRRLDKPEDWVRDEVAAALRRGILVLPVLVDGAKMPRPDDLPGDIALIARKQFKDISDTRWDYDVGDIVRVLEGVVPPQPDSERRPSPWPARWKRILRWAGWSLAGAVALFAAAITVTWMTATRPGDYEWRVDPPQIRLQWDQSSNAPLVVEVKVTNSGRKSASFALSVSWQGAPPSPGVLELKDDTCKSQPIAAGSSCSAKIVFDPQWFNGDERARQFDGALWVWIPNKRGGDTPLSISTLK
jgi:hypothetical protein